jgi:hypothetical protein
VQIVLLKDVAYLLLAYGKSEKEDLTSDERRALSRVIEELQDG